MLDDFYSSVLSGYLKNAINNSAYYHYRLRLLANCCTYGEYKHGIQIISNGTATRILGVRPCKHSWACPECTAREMSNYSKRIAAGIDALYKKDLVPFMMTLTVFHTIQQDCETSYNILRKAWELMDKQKTWRRKKKDGSYYVNAGAWSQFYNEFNCKHTVKTLEITYGKHGWHPHIHMLVWVHKSKLQEVAKWEPKLQKLWEQCEDRAAKQIIGSQTNEYQIRKFLISKPTRDDYEHQGLYISKENNGKIKAWSSAFYLCGWGGNNELTGLNLKQAHGTNMTPFQMLERSYDLRYKNPIESQRLLEKYMYFAWVVIKNRISRVAFSRTGLKTIIDNWLQSEEFKLILKKNIENQKINPYHNVAWFNVKQWREICFSNDYMHLPLIPLIRAFAKYEDGYNLICELMIVNGLDPPIAKQHPTIDWAKAFNEKAQLVA